MIKLEKRHIFIALYRARALLKTEGSRTYLRYLWWLFDPFIELCLFYVVFGLIAQKGGPGFIAEILVGVIVVRLFIIGTATAPNLLIHNEHILLSVALPKYIFPFAHVTACFIKYIFLLLALCISLLLLGIHIQLSWLVCIPISACYVFFVLGVAMLLSAITPFFPDIDQLYPKITMILYWASGVFFRPEDYFVGDYINYFYLNPVAYFIYLYRECLLGSQFSISYVFVPALLGVGSLLAGYSVLSYFDKQYPRIIAK